LPDKPEWDAQELSEVPEANHEGKEHDYPEHDCTAQDQAGDNNTDLVPSADAQRKSYQGNKQRELKNMREF
jgi:hypothetical protein